jgi:NADPH:quinone reductase-like Zn-dependent oxidoreductase
LFATIKRELVNRHRFPTRGAARGAVFEFIEVFYHDLRRRGQGFPRRGKRVLSEIGSYVSVRSSTKEKSEDLLVLRDLMEAGEVKAVIDRRYSLEQIPEGHLYVEKGNKRGNVVITVGS